jgi:kynurenine formamidase
VIDIPKYLGIDVLPNDYAINGHDIQNAIRSTHQKIKPGDVALVRTGWGRYWNEPSKFNNHEGIPGINLEAARFMVSEGISHVGSDTTACEVVPSSSMEVHAYLIAENGIQIMEMLNLESLSEAGISEALFIALPLSIRGGTGSPIRPIAIR